MTVKERPILFSGEMVRATLEGRKTQTRRVCKRGPDVATTGTVYKYGDIWVPDKCPYGQPGDRLWVRETWKPGAWRDDGRIAIDYKASPELTHTPWVTLPDDGTGENVNDLFIKWTDELIDKGSIPDEDGVHHWEAGQSPFNWRSSIFMPRWASRILLEITEVRVERLQEISEDDSIAEGIETWNCYFKDYSKPDSNPGWLRDPIESYRTLWDSINGKSHPWDSNPWVWVIEFKVLTPTGVPNRPQEVVVQS